MADDRNPSDVRRRVVAVLRRVWRAPARLIGAGGDRADARLVVCGACRSRLVNPVNWHESDESHWWILLRCGECEWTREVVVTDDEAKRLERDLKPGLDEIARAVERLDRERMLCEADRFAAALQRDLIGPADFARHLPK
jgi:hypothetical protein